MIVGVPVHVPRSAVRVPPSRVVPEIAGAAVLTGGAAATRALAAVVAGVLPAPLAAVTTTRIVSFASADVSL